jgi:hypothetical protein
MGYGKRHKIFFQIERERDRRTFSGPGSAVPVLFDKLASALVHLSLVERSRETRRLNTARAIAYVVSSRVIVA